MLPSLPRGESVLKRSTSRREYLLKWNESAPRLTLVLDHPQESLAFLLVFFLFYAERGLAVNYTEDAAALLALGHNDLQGVGGGAIDSANLWDLLDAVQTVDGKHILHENDKSVAATNLDGILLGEVDEAFIIAIPSHESLAARLAKGDAKLHTRGSLNQRLVQIFDLIKY